MAYNPFEAAAFVAFRSFLQYQNFSSKQTLAQQSKVKRSSRERSIVYACSDQKDLLPYYPIISYFSEGLEYILLETPTLGSDILNHVMCLEEKPNRLVASVLEKKQLEYLTQTAHTLGKHKKNDLSYNYSKIQEKQTLVARIFTATSSQITRGERADMLILAQKVDDIKEPPHGQIYFLPTITPKLP